MLALLNSFSIGRILAWIGKSAAASAVLEWLLDKVGVVMGHVYALSYWLFPGLWEKAYKEMEPGIVAAAQIASGPAATIARSMTGLPIDAGAMASVLTGGLSAGERDSLGAGFTAIFDDIFQPGPIAEGYRSRLPGSAERKAFERFIGRNAQLQMAGMMADLVKDRLPKDLTLGLGDIVERAEKIMGFEDSQEEIMEPLMEKLIIEGLNKHYNRLTKPVDLSPGDAVDAFLRAYISEQTLNAILDNEGIRDDVRPTLLNLRAKNLTESDFRDLYQRGAWTRDDVFAGYRANGYVQDDAEDKTSLVVADRMWALRKELMNVKETQFAHGILDEGAFRAFLVQSDFTNEEIDLEVEIGKAKASLVTTRKPKTITGTFNVAPWRVKPGSSAVMSWNIRNATNVTISGIGGVEHRGERVIQPDISQTYVLDASSDTDSERFEAVVQVGDTHELKRPTASFSASPGRITVGTPVELKWATNNAESVSIDQVGPVAEAGAIPVFPFLSTIYTLRARNAQGETIRQDIVFVELPDLGFGKELRPLISFSITPTVVKAAQPQAELNWSITRAEGGELTFPDGTKHSVSRNGAMIVTATASGIYTLKASNVHGETQNQEALIFQGAGAETP